MKLTYVGTSLLVLGLAGRTEAANFAVITAPPTPTSAHSLMIWEADVMGVAMTARSTGAFNSLMEGQAGSFHIFL